MGKKKKSGNEKRLSSLLLITAIIQLIHRHLLSYSTIYLNEIQGREISLVRKRYTFSFSLST